MNRYLAALKARDFQNPISGVLQEVQEAPLIAAFAVPEYQASENIAVPANDSTALDAELRAVVAVVCAAAGERDPEGWLLLALAEPAAALTCYRALAANLGLVAAVPRPDDRDDRRTCRQCANYASANGRCLAAVRGELPYVVSRDYSPAPEPPRRCEGYAPRPGDNDRRRGRERWPGLTEATP